MSQETISHQHTAAPAALHITLTKQELSSKEAKQLEKRARHFSRRRLFSFNTLGWCISDALIAVTAVTLGYALSPVAFYAATSETAVTWLPCAISFVLVLVPMAHIAGLHSSRSKYNNADLFVRCLLTVVLAASVISLGWMMFSFLRIGRYVLIISSVFSIVSMIASRRLLWRMASEYKPKICFFGKQEFAQSAVAFVDKNPIPVDVSNSLNPDTSLRHWAIENDIAEVVFDACDQADETALLDCLDAGVRVSTYSDFIEERYQLIPVDSIDAKWLFSTRLDLAHPYYQGVKRLVDVAVAVVGLILSVPILILTAIIIKLESKGPIFYSQIRTGRFNRPFRIYKLRTMVSDSEKNGAQWASKNDARITGIGKILRKTRIDEIPQFWNVLIGDMSLIGPRPERPEFVSSLAEEIPFYMQRHLVKPGLSGWAQINYPYGASVQDAYNKLTFDYYYIKNASVGLDLQIVLRTIGTIMKGSR